MTLVGGNWSNAHVPPGTIPSQSVWHDSDRTQGGTADNVYNNAFDGAGNWSLSDYVTNSVTGYTYLCPGVQKPDKAMSNYDAAYYRDQDAITGSGSYAWRIAGEKGQDYGTPGWTQDGELEYTILDVPNELILGMHKEVYLLVDFESGLYDEFSAPAIVVKASGTIDDTPELTISEGSGQILYHWEFDDQPDSEHDQELKKIWPYK